MDVGPPPREPPTQSSVGTTTDLFSDGYLTERLRDTDTWNDPSDGDIRRAADELETAWKELNPDHDSADSRARNRFVDAVFDILGAPNDAETGDRAVGSEGVAVVDVRRWGRPLDGRGTGEGERDFEHPSYRLSVTLRETPARWGLLTNGRRWRLYADRAYYRLDRYYEIDLPTVLEMGDFEAFERFYRLFRHEAFVENANDECLLDEMEAGNRAFTREMSVALRGNVREALGVLATGFFEHPDNDLGRKALTDSGLCSEHRDEFDRARFDLVFDSSVVYLYRLISVRFAERAGTTPSSLLDMGSDEHVEVGGVKRTSLWERLNERFRLVGSGNHPMASGGDVRSLPPYDGELFRTTPTENDGREARFLARYRVDDEHLESVIDLLTYRAGATGGKSPIEYSALDVRVLGTLYEHLLEYKLVEGTDGEVTLATDSAGRKSTGTFYTPKPVVESIVETTLEPLVERAYDELDAEDGADDTCTFAESFAERVLELNVVDPAMGCGGFLTGVMEYLSWEIVGARGRQAEKLGVETLDGDHGIEWARRRVAEHCLYGVDMNPFAVELTTVSLWLRTLDAGGPQASLTGHLQVGNALIGSDDGNVVTDRPVVRNRLEAMANVSTAEGFGLASIPENWDERMRSALEVDEEWATIERTPWFRTAQRWADERRYFHWKLAFPDVYAGSSADEESYGFDAVVGNPPYLKSHHIGPDLDAVLQREYETVDGGAYDSYVPFIELANRLRSTHGRVGYIVPNRFFEANYGTALRRYLVERRCLSNIVDFGETRLFDGASTYTCLLFLAGDAETFEYLSVSDVDGFIAGKSVGKARTYDHTNLGERWNFVVGDPGRIIEKMTDETVAGGTLGDASRRIFKGFDTGLASLYRVTNVAESKGGYTVYSEQSGCEVEIEGDLLVPLLKGKDIEPYAVDYRNRLLFFPYRTHETGHELLEEAELEESYPNAYRYLKAHEPELRARQNGAYDDEGWYRYTNPRNLHRYRTGKICSPYNSFAPAFASDDSGLYFTTGFAGGYGTILEETAPDFRDAVTAILNSTPTQFFVERTSTPMRGNYFSYEKRFIGDVPLPLTDFSTTMHARAKLAKDGIRLAESVVFDAGDASSLFDAVRTLLRTEHGIESVYHVLAWLADTSGDVRDERRRLNPTLLDFLGTEFDGPTVGNLPSSRPSPNGVDGLLSATTRTSERLRLGTVEIEERGTTTTISATARDKPAPESDLGTDRWGFTETALRPAIEFVEPTAVERILVSEFVPHVVETGDGFAGFRPMATKTNSLVDRLEAIRLPTIDAVADDVRRYAARKRRVEQLTGQLERATAAIDTIVYELYGLTDGDIETVESSLVNDRPS